MMSSSSFIVLLAMLALAAVFVEAAGRPWGSWTDTTLQNFQEDEEEGVTIPTFLHDYESPLDADKINEYAASLEDHTLGDRIVEFCRDAKLICNSNITIDNLDMDIFGDDFHNLDPLVEDTSKSNVYGQALQFYEKDFVKGKDIVLPESLHDLPNPSPSFLPQFLAEKMPLSSEKIQELLDTFHILYNSNMANMMFRTISRCESVKEKSSKEIEVVKEKEIKEKEIDCEKKESKEKEIEFTTEKEVEEKKNEMKNKESEEKEIGFTAKKEVEENEIETKEKEMKECDIHVKKEKSSEEKKVEDKETEYYKEEEVKEKEKKMKESDICVKKEKSSEEKKVEEKETEYHEKEEVKEKEKEMKECDIHVKKEKSSEEKKVEDKEIEYHKEEEVKEKEKKMKESDIHVKKEKSSDEEKVEEKETEYHKKEEVKEKEKEMKEMDIHGSDENSSKEKKFKEKEIEYHKEEEMKEKDIHRSEENSNEEEKAKGIKFVYDEEEEMKEKADIHVNEEKSNEDNKVKKEEIDDNMHKEMKETDVYVRKEESSKETRKCVTSLEGMTSFVKKSLPKEKHIKALERSSSTKFVDKEYKKIKWKIFDIKEYEKAVICKNNIFLFVVFECHHISKTKGKRIYYIELEGTGGIHRKEILACDDQKKSDGSLHRKTKNTFNIKISCHWVTNSLVWAPDV